MSDTTEPSSEDPSVPALDIVIVTDDPASAPIDIATRLSGVSTTVVAKIGTPPGFAEAANRAAFEGRAPRILFIGSGVAPSVSVVNAMRRISTGRDTGLVTTQTGRVRAGATVRRWFHNRLVAMWPARARVKADDLCVVVARDVFQIAGGFSDALGAVDPVEDLKARVRELGRTVLAIPNRATRTHRRLHTRTLNRARETRRKHAESGRAHGLVLCSLERWNGGTSWRGHEMVIAALMNDQPEQTVLYVEPAYRPFNELRSRIKTGRVFQRHFWHRGLRPADDLGRVVRFQPIEVVPRFVGRWAELLRDTQVRLAARRLDLRAPVLIVNDPDYVTLRRRVCWPVIADVTDDWDQIGPLQDPARRAHETALVAAADAVIIRDTELSQTQSWSKTNMEVVPDVSWSGPSRRPSWSGAASTGATAAYAGHVSADVLDVDVLLTAIEALPDLTWLLIGPVDLASDVRAKLRSAGVLLLGQRSLVETAQYMRSVDLLVLPFQPNEVTRRTAPIILEEVRAVGTPVVVTGMSNRPRADADVTIVEGHDFVEAVRAASSKKHKRSWKDERTVEQKVATIRRLSVAIRSESSRSAVH